MYWPRESVTVNYLGPVSGEGKYPVAGYVSQLAVGADLPSNAGEQAANWSGVLSDLGAGYLY